MGDFPHRHHLRWEIFLQLTPSYVGSSLHLTLSQEGDFLQLTLSYVGNSPKLTLSQMGDFLQLTQSHVKDSPLLILSYIGDFYVKARFFLWKNAII